MKDFFKKIIVYLITLEAKLVIKKYKPKIVAVTGTVGKTSVKDAIFCAFSGVVYARKSTKSFNSEIGLPLTILGCSNAWNNPILWLRNILTGLELIIFPRKYPEYLILEVGADHPGDIQKVAEWLPVSTAVFTKMSKIPVHVEFFGSPEEVFKEKMALLKALETGKNIVFNYDDQIIQNHMEEVSGFRKTSYGFDKDADITFSHYRVIYSRQSKMPTGINFKVNFQGSSLPVNLKNTIGGHQIYAVLAGLAAASAEGINLVKAQEGLDTYESPPGRMKLIKGLKESVIIDDTYNSSPVALAEAIHVLHDLKSPGRKIAVLGDMMELGKYSVDQHRKAGEMVAQFADFLITVGVRAKYIAEGAIDAGMPGENIIQFDDSRLAGKQVELLLQKGDVVLVKGSQAVRMEKTVEEIMADPMKKGEMLVRQEEAWRSR